MRWQRGSCVHCCNPHDGRARVAQIDRLRHDEAAETVVERPDVLVCVDIVRRVREAVLEPLGSDANPNAHGEYLGSRVEARVRRIDHRVVGVDVAVDRAAVVCVDRVRVDAELHLEILDAGNDLLIRHGAVREQDAGGLLAPHRNGKPLELCFSRAEFVAGKRAFERAERPHARDHASFIPELPGLLRASGRLRIVDGADEARKAVGERFRFVETNGHTPGMLHATAVGERAELLFGADMVPGVAWLHASITMGYDRYPEHLVDEKAGIFQQCVERQTVIVYTHDPRVAASRVERDARGRFAPTDAVGEFSRWDLNGTRAPLAA